MLECKMVRECYEYLLETKEFTNIVCEVPFLSRCIDMVVVNNKEIITIEFKIKNWRHALEQVKSHKLGADKAYICLPIRKPSSVLLNALQIENVGLYLYLPNNPEVMVEFLPAPKNVSKVNAFSDILNDKVNQLSEYCVP